MNKQQRQAARKAARLNELATEDKIKCYLHYSETNKNLLVVDLPLSGTASPFY